MLELPVNVTVAVVQVSEPLLLATTFAGTVVFWFTVVVAIVLHPFAGLVTVRV